MSTELNTADTLTAENQRLREALTAIERRCPAPLADDTMADVLRDLRHARQLDRRALREGR